MKRRTHSKADRRGTLTIEVALLVPVLILMVFGTAELHRINTIRSSIDNAAYEGARVGTIPGATAQQAEDRCLEILASVGIKNATVTVTPAVIQPDSDSVSVDVSVPLAGNSLHLLSYLTTGQMQKNCSLLRMSVQ